MSNTAIGVLALAILVALLLIVLPAENGLKQCDPGMSAVENEEIVPPEATGSIQGEALSSVVSWVGEVTMEGETRFIRVGPQVFGPPQTLFHYPNNLLFNMELRNLVVDNNAISFQVNDGKQTISYEGIFDGKRYNGIAQSENVSGDFFLYPVAGPAENSILSTYAGNYEIGAGIYRTVGFEDLGGLVETRIYYKDGDDFVLMFPLSTTEFLTGLGELIRFAQEDGIVTSMVVVEADGECVISKVSLYTEEEVSFRSGDTTIAGTLMVPNSPGPHPAVIIAHNSGVGERHGYWLFASGFAQDGLAVLAYDRRGYGHSTGNVSLDTDILAEDMKAGYAFLQSHPAIDPLRIGLMGFSNGSWVAPRAAQDLSDEAFIVVSMASAVSQVDAELFRRETVLRDIGISEESIAQAMDANRLYFKGAVTPFTEAEVEEFTAMYQALMENNELQNATGIRLLPTHMPLEEILDAAGLFSSMGFSPAETYLDTDAPIAFFLGELDGNIPPELSITTMEDVMAQRPEADITMVVFPDTLHSMFVLAGPVQGMSQDLLIANVASYRFASGYLAQQRAWLKEKTGLN